MRPLSSLVLAVPLVVAWAACGAAGDPASGDSSDPSGSGGAASSGSAGPEPTSASGGGASGGGGATGCAAGTADCNADPADGCETSTDTDSTNCGACDVVCPTAMGAKVGCVGGQCVITCEAGYADCNQMASDGCEVITATDVANCGMCGNACPDGPSDPATCIGGVCTLDCPAGTGSCDGNAANGCETDVTVDSNNCGACGIDCLGAECIQGACACATDTQTAEPLQLDLFIMLDQSGSMADPVSGGGTKWDAVKSALQGFFTDPLNAGLGVGIQFFALPPTVPPPIFCQINADCGVFGPCMFGFCVGNNGGGGDDSCNPADYAIPAVEIAPLNPAQANALSGTIDSHSPTTDTPTGPALQGAIDHAKTWATAHPTHAVVVVLATDGDPTECNPMDIPSIAAIAASGNGGNPSIKTFVIGVGSSLNNLNAIAQGGGTGSAYLVDTNQNVVQQFEAALQAIQENALGCEYVIPQPMMGVIDYTKVNVEYTPGGGNPQVILNVPNAAGCDPQTGGWYYDDPAMPTKILLCPATCNVVQNDRNGKIEIVLGCDTQHT